MNQRNTRRGFTLIELLVVVIIIGILAAVAVPQYQKAVEKSRFVEAVTTLKSLAQAHQACCLEKGEACNIEDMALEFEGEVVANQISTDKFQYLASVEDVWGNPIWARVQYNDADVCLCYLQTGEIVLAQHADECIVGVDNEIDYSSLLNIPDVTEEHGCGCC